MVRPHLVRQVGVYDSDAASLDSAVDFSSDAGLTQQHMAPATEIDSIMGRYYASGEMPRAKQLAEYGDFDDSMDLQDMLYQLSRGQQAFSQVPSGIRAKFENNPGIFLDWIHDEANYDEAAGLGLVPARQFVEPVAPVVAAKADGIIERPEV